MTGGGGPLTAEMPSGEGASPQHDAPAVAGVAAGEGNTSHHDAASREGQAGVGPSDVGQRPGAEPGAGLQLQQQEQQSSGAGDGGGGGGPSAPQPTGGTASDATTSSSPPGDAQQQARASSVAAAAAAAAALAGGLRPLRQPSPASTAQHPAPAAAALPQELQGIPILPDVVRQKEAKRDLPMICHIEGCGVDLSSQAEYYQRYRICKGHLKSPALLVDGVPQRFCQQCGRFHELSEFDGEKRNCRARLEQHNSRRRKVFVTAQSTRRSRYQKDKPLQSRLPAGEEGEEAEPMLTDEPGLPPQYSSRGRGKQLAGSRRGRSDMEEDDGLRLTPQEKEAILLLRQAERPGLGGGPQRSLPQQAMPRFMSEPVRGTHGWRAGSGDAAPASLQDDELMMLHPQLQDLLGQQQYLARQEQIAAAGLQAVAGRLGGGASAFTSVSPQPSVRGNTSLSQLGLPSFPSGSLGAGDARLMDLLAGSNAPPALAGNPFATGAAAAAGILDPSGGVYRTFTEPARNQPQPAPRVGRTQAPNPQTLVPTIPRDGLSGSRPRDAAELLRTLHAATNPQQAATAEAPGQGQGAQQAQQMANPFMQQRGGNPAMPSMGSNPLGSLGNVAALLAPPGSGMPKASTLLRQMADLAASAELTMEQAALQQAQAGQRPMMDAFPAPFQLAAEELLRRSSGPGGGRQGSAGGSGGAGGGGRSAGPGISNTELLAALTGLAPLQPEQPEPAPSQQQQQQQHQQQKPPAGAAAQEPREPPPERLWPSQRSQGGGNAQLPPEQLLAALLSASGAVGGLAGSNPALVQDLMSLIQGSVGLGAAPQEQQAQQNTGNTM